MPPRLLVPSHVESDAACVRQDAVLALTDAFLRAGVPGRAPGMRAGPLEYMCRRPPTRSAVAEERSVTPYRCALYACCRKHPIGS